MRSMNSKKTKSGTIVVDDIEYNECPPSRLVKMMSCCWATKLVNKGMLRIRHLDYFRKRENSVLGDPNEGKGLFHLNGRSMNIESSSDVYIWCSSFPAISKERMRLLAKQGDDYNCKLVIHDPHSLIQKISDWLSRNIQGSWVQCGAVCYNRGEEVSKSTLNSQKFHCNVFQKAESFSEDNEYRVSVTIRNSNKLKQKYIDLNLGDCRELLSIEKL